MSEHHEHHGTVLAQPDETETRSRVIAMMVGLLVITFAVTAYILWTVFVREADTITHRVVLSKTNPELEALRARELEDLRSSAVLDPDRGIHRIPIDQAIPLFVREAQARRQAGLPQRIEEPAVAVGEEAQIP